ncbi:MAG: hypothetical protein QF733_04670 [Phycisphaerales bacterium]|jgi:hypothetical protein|nr:hypothetical protein [Phycisphaerales bacterium]
MMTLSTVMLAVAMSAAEHHIAVIGASASAGWGVVVPHAPSDHEVPVHHRHVDLADVLPAVLGCDASDVSGHADVWFFSAPERIGPTLLDAAKSHQPTHIIAIDFLFWFAYGNRDVNDEPLGTGDIEARLANLNHGLHLLESIDVPLLIGDLPDVADAADVWPIPLLRANQVPSPEALDAMNRRIRVWAAAREHATLVPLAATVDRMKRGKPLQLNGHVWPKDATLIQFDHLHPTTLGLIAIAELAAESLPPDTKPALHADPQSVLKRLAEVQP